MPKDTKLYDILGVTQSANESEVKKAYYKKARLHHPDKIEDESMKSEAEEKFKEIKFAYEVLTDAKKRETYDRYGLEGLKEGAGGRDFEDLFGRFFGGGGGGGGFFPFGDLFGGGGGRHAGHATRQRTKNIFYPLNVTLEDFYNGKTKTIELDRQIVCIGCKGSGSKSGAPSTCRGCKGNGFVIHMKRFGGGMIQQMQAVCPDCNGEGESIDNKDKCKQCLGKKVSKQKKSFEVHIDKGMQDGQKITFSGESNQSYNCETGDFVVVLKQIEHDVFTRHENDLYMKYKINLTEALCGFKIMIEHLDGRHLIVNNPAGEVLAPGSSRCISKEGMPIYKNPYEKGNLYIKFDVEFPENDFISKESFKKLEAFLPPRPKHDMPKDDLIEEVEMHKYNDNLKGSKASDYFKAFMNEDEEEEEEEIGEEQERVQCATH